MAAKPIPVTVTEEQGFRIIPMDFLKESPYNARRLYNQTQLEELAASIKANGIVQPIVTRQVDAHYEVVAGSRRRRAAILAGLEEVPILIKALTDDQAREISLIENIQREDVHPMHEALGMKDALSVGGYDIPRLASRLGKHERHIYKRLQICRLIEPMQQAFLDGWMSLGAAVATSKLNIEHQEKAHAYWYSKKPTYVTDEQEVNSWIERNILVRLDHAPFDLKDATLVPSAGACVVCEKRTGAMPMLWDDKQEDRCTDADCYKVKVDASLDRKREKLTKKHGADGFVHISSHYRSYGEKHEGLKVLSSSDYQEVEKGSCESAKPGLNVEGAVGKIKWICADKLCAVHGRGTTSSDPDRQRQKAAEKESAVRGRVFQAILKKYPEQTTRKLREFVAVKFANRLTHDVDITLAKLLKLDVAKGYGAHYPGLVSKMTDRELEVFMLAVALAPEAKVFTYSSHERNGPLFEIANEFGVDLTSIDAYCNAFFAARLKRGNERKSAMEALPVDPADNVNDSTSTAEPASAPLTKPTKSVKKKAAKKSA